MDFVYTFKEDHENDSEELRYSLRSLANIPHGRVFIVGEKPQWAQNVIHIPVAQDKSKNENVGLNIRTAVTSQAISDDFVLMNDDFFFMKPFDSLPVWHFGDMKHVIEHYERRYQEETAYISNMRHSYSLLQKLGIQQPISYELHAPMIINKHKAREMLDQFQNRRMYQFRSLYGNLYAVGGEETADFKVFLDPVHNSPAYNLQPISYLEQQAFLSATGGSFKRGDVGKFIRHTFSEKCTYER